jgi:hypothetical protein
VTWWAWTVLWLILVIGAAGYLFLIGRSLWRRASALFTELGRATTLVDGMSEQVGALMAAFPAQPESAVFADPEKLRRARDRDIKRRVRAGRAAARRKK